MGKISMSLIDKISQKVSKIYCMDPNILREQNESKCLYINGDKTILVTGKVLKTIYSKNPSMRFPIRNAIHTFNIDDEAYYIDPNAYKFLEDCLKKFSKIVVVTNKQNIVTNYKLKLAIKKINEFSDSTLINKMLQDLVCVL